MTVNGALTPPPGEGFDTATGNAPALTSKLAGTVAESWVALVNVPGIAAPLKETALAETKPLPTITSGVAALPTRIVAGLTEVTVTPGFETTKAIGDAPRRRARGSSP